MSQYVSESKYLGYLGGGGFGGYGDYGDFGDYGGYGAYGCYRRLWHGALPVERLKENIQCSTSQAQLIVDHPSILDHFKES